MLIKYSLLLLVHNSLIKILIHNLLQTTTVEVIDSEKETCYVAEIHKIKYPYLRR